MLSFFLSSLALSAQETIKDSVKQKRDGLVLIPSTAPNCFGLSLGPLGSEVWCGLPYYKKSHGITNQIIGQGAFWMFQSLNTYHRLGDEIKDPVPIDTMKKYDQLRAIHKGLIISTLGAFDTKVNGLVISPFFGSGQTLNGLSINLIRNQYLFVNGIELGLINEAGKVNGLQLGLINKTSELNGLQIGLWNVNEKRKLPILNW